MKTRNILIGGLLSLLLGTGVYFAVNNLGEVKEKNDLVDRMFVIGGSKPFVLSADGNVYQLGEKNVVYNRGSWDYKDEVLYIFGDTLHIRDGYVLQKNDTLNWAWD